MANFGFSLRSTLGLIPKTDKIEETRINIENEYNKLNSFISSDLLIEYNELNEYIKSNEFIDFKKNILALDYKKTEEFKQEQRYLKLAKNKAIVNYFKVLESDDYKKFIATNESETLTQYQKLVETVASSDHKQVKVELAQKLIEETTKKKDFLKLEKSKKFKNFFSIQASGDLENYKNIDGSELLAEYNDLKQIVDSGKLKDAEETEKATKRFNELKNSEEIKKYLKFAKSKQLAAYQQLNDSSALNDFLAQKEYLESDEHKQAKAESDEKLKDEIVKEKSFLKLENSKQFKTFFRIQASDEFINYKNIDGSELLTEYNDLKQITESNKLKDAEEKAKITKRYNELKNSVEIKKYLKFAKSKQLIAYQQLNDSSELNEFIAQKEYIESDEYSKKIELHKYENSEAFSNEQLLDELKSNEDITHWQKIGKSKIYLLFVKTEDSEILKEYEQLNENVNSDKFIEQKNYMLDKEKYQKTEEYAKEQRFIELSNSDEIKWYLKIKDTKKFDELKKWKITFEEKFNTNKINDEIWMNSFFWGKMILNDRYVMAGDKQYYTDNNNFDLSSNSLKIVTKNETTQGRVWHPLHGFSNQDFNYTSGMLSTAHSFRQLYGKFEAKIKIDSSAPVYQAFWLKGEKILPEIDIFKFNMTKANKMFMSSIIGEPNDFKNATKSTSKLNGATFSKDYYIYSVDWTPEKISWKINNIEVYSTTSNIPNEALYILLSAGIQQETNGSEINSAYEIDWVRCYERIDN